MIALLDTDSLLALLNVQSMYHFGVKTVSEQLVRLGVDSMVLPTTLDEVSLLAAPHIGQRHTRESLSHLITSGVSTAELTTDITAQALQLYGEDTKDKLLMSEAFVIAAARALSVDCILSFNPTYPLYGLRLAESFVREYARLKDL